MRFNKVYNERVTHVRNKSMHANASCLEVGASAQSDAFLLQHPGIPQSFICLAMI